MEQKFKLKLESLRLKNFRALRNAEIKNIPNYCVLVGANGVGKSTVFSVFEFLKKYLREAPNGFLYKMLRKKNITLNSGRFFHQKSFTDIRMRK